jgi:hypothetical protein
MWINGFDINGCTTGLYLKTYINYAWINNFHVEFYGNYSVSGYGIYFANYSTNGNIKITNSDIILPSTNAVNAIYLPPITTVTKDANTITFENVYVDKITGKKALQLDGRFTWNGNFDYTNADVGLYGSFNKLLNGKIIPTNNHYVSRNLLPVTKPTALTDFTYKAGTNDVKD